jgi:uncharacterized protein (TIRG00374 family)
MVRVVLQTVLKVGLAGVLIYWMIQKGVLDIQGIINLASPPLVVFCLGCVFLQIFVNNIRWLLLLRGQGLASTMQYTLPLSFIGMFFNFVMPGGVGGDVVKGYYLLQDYPHQRMAGAISIFMDRMVGFFVMIATAFIAVFLNWDAVAHSRELQSVALGVTLLFVVFVVFFTLALSRRLGRRAIESRLGHLVFVAMPGGRQLRRVYDTVHTYRKQPMIFFLSCVLSFINQFLLVAFVVGIAFSMGIRDIPLLVYFFIVPIGIVVTALPISPAGIGVGQAAFYFLFSLYLGKQSQLGPTSATVFQVTNFAMGLVGAFFYLIRKKPIAAARARA